MWYSPAVEYHLPLKRNDVSVHGTIWMAFENAKWEKVVTKDHIVVLH
jgi:hypothetical protein